MGKSNIKTVYLDTNKEGYKFRCDLYYSLGGVNMLTYKNEQRGYYIAVTPIEKRGNIEGFAAFSGVKKCVVPVSRKSTKKEKVALAVYRDGKTLKSLIDYVGTKNNLELATGADIWL